MSQMVMGGREMLNTSLSIAYAHRLQPFSWHMGEIRREPRCFHSFSLYRAGVHCLLLAKMLLCEHKHMLEAEKPLVELSAPVSEWVYAFNTGDVTAIVALYTDDAELLDSGMPRPRHGRQEIERWFTLRFQSMPTNRYIPASQIVEENGDILVTWVLHGWGPRLLGQSWLSRPFQANGVSRFRLRDRLICWQEGTYDHLAVLRQIVPLFLWCPTWLAHFVYSLYLRIHSLL